MKLIRKEFSKKNRDKGYKRIELEDIDSHRGLGRSFIVGRLSGALGGYASKSKANDLDKKGASDDEIVKGASKYGGKVGLGVGAGLGLASGAVEYSNKMRNAEALDNFLRYYRTGLRVNKAKVSNRALGKAAGAAAMVSALGGVGGYLGSKKNAKERVNKRLIIEAKQRRK